MRPIPRPARRVRRVAVACAATLVLGLPFVRTGTPSWWGLPLVVALFAVAAPAVVPLPLGRAAWRVTLTEVLLGCCLIGTTSSWLVPAVVVGTIASPAVRRQPRFKAEFDIAVSLAGITAAVLAAAAFRGTLGPPALSVHASGAWTPDLVGPVAAAAIGLFAAWVVQHVLGCTAVAFTSRRSVASLVARNAPPSLLQYVANCAVGMLGAWVAVHAPVGVIGFAVPAVLLWSAHTVQQRSSAESRLYAELAYASRQASSQSLDTSAEVVLTTAARVLGGADVEMVVRDRQGPVRYVGDEHSTPQRRRVPPGVFDEPWVMRLLAGRRVLTGVEDGRPYCAGVIGRRDAPVAVLVARRPEGSAAFGRRDLLIALAIVSQAEPWLAGGRSTTGGERRERAADGYDLVRETAERLARSAAHPAGADAITELTQELHEVESAVALLLGSVAADSTSGSADPSVGDSETSRDSESSIGAVDANPGRGEVSTGSDAAAPLTNNVSRLVPRQRPSGEWTTTGVLPVAGGDRP